MSNITFDSSYAETLKCNRCGFCQAACPTFKVSRNETQVARGRIRLARLLAEGRHDWLRDEGLMDKVNDCLLCRACVANCPSSVNTDEIMLAFRRDHVAKEGLPVYLKLLYRGVLSRRERFERMSLLMRLYKKSGAGGIFGTGVLPKALDKLAYFDSFLPKNISAPARRTLPPVMRPEEPPIMKVAYFIGCASNVFFPKMLETVTAYLVKRGVEVHIPKVVCCGEPHRSGGDFEEADRLALKNIDTLFSGDYDFIVSDCSTCVSSLTGYARFLNDGGLAPEALVKLEAGLKKVVDLNTLVYEHLTLDPNRLKTPDGPRKTVVTYHDPCHAVRGLNIKTAPRRILASLPHIEFREMDEADSCCGGAGSYSFTHPQMSEKIAAAKAANIKNSGAEILATSCPACALQLGAGLKREQPQVGRVAHPVELLAEATL